MSNLTPENFAEIIKIAESSLAALKFRLEPFIRAPTEEEFNQLANIAEDLGSCVDAMFDVLEDRIESTHPEVLQRLTAEKKPKKKPQKTGDGVATAPTKTKRRRPSNGAPGAPGAPTQNPVVQTALDANGLVNSSSGESSDMQSG